VLRAGTIAVDSLSQLDVADNKVIVTAANSTRS
jgi:hypothetical protein